MGKSKTPIYALDHFHEADPDPLTKGWDDYHAALREEAQAEGYASAGTGNCINCGEEFEIPRNVINRTRMQKRFCGPTCGSSFRRKLRREQRLRGEVLQFPEPKATGEPKMHEAKADQTQALDILRRIEDALRTNKARLVIGDETLSIELLDWNNEPKFRLVKVEASNYVELDAVG